jgi:hypothetical protein
MIKGQDQQGEFRYTQQSTHTKTRMTRPNTAFVVCNSNICEGEGAQQPLATEHKKNAEQVEGKAARDGAADGPIHEVPRWTLGGQTSNSQQKGGDAIWKRDGEEYMSVPSPSPTAHAPIPSPASSASSNNGTPVISPTCGERKKTLYDELKLLDKTLESRISNIVYILGADPPMLSTDLLKDHEMWLRNTLQTLQAMKSGDDLETKTLLIVMLACVEDHILKIETHIGVSAGEVLGREAEEFDTGMY